MAAPYVSGIAALMMAKNPSLMKNPEQLKNIMMQSVDTKNALLGKAASNGRVNAFKALQAIVAAPVKMNWVSKAHSINEKSYHKELVDVRHKINVPKAKAMRVHFDFVQIQEPFDSIYLYDQNLRLITHLEETQSRDHWSAVIPGDTVHVRFTNSLVREMQMGFAPPQTSESACMALGAEEVVQTGSEFRCMTDSEDSSGSKTYSTFNSEGFSIDRIEYVPGEGEKK